jgi:hypothetical protein
MKSTRIILFIAILSVASTFHQAAAQAERPVLERRHSIGSTVFLLGNLIPGDPPHFFQLNYGYRPTEKEVIVVEAITWTYYEPMGTYGSSVEHYPGKIRAIGVGVGYQRFLWKNLYSTVLAVPFLQQFFDADNNRIQSGFQLFLQLRLGWHIELFNQRWFLEPSVTGNYWPINTNFPASFMDVEDGSPNYFLFEPGLHFGFRF